MRHIRLSWTLLGHFADTINFVIGITDSLWKQTIMLTNLKTSSSLRLRVLFFLHRKFYLYVQWLEFFAINIVGLILIRGSYYNESAVNAP